MAARGRSAGPVSGTQPGGSGRKGPGARGLAYTGAQPLGLLAGLWGSVQGESGPQGGPARPTKGVRPGRRAPLAAMTALRRIPHALRRQVKIGRAARRVGRPAGRGGCMLGGGRPQAVELGHVGGATFVPSRPGGALPHHARNALTKRGSRRPPASHTAAAAAALPQDAETRAATPPRNPQRPGQSPPSQPHRDPGRHTPYNPQRPGQSHPRTRRRDLGGRILRTEHICLVRRI